MLSLLRILGNWWKGANQWMGKSRRKRASFHRSALRPGRRGFEGLESRALLDAAGLPDPVAPQATLNAPNLVASGGDHYDFTVTYADNVAVQGSTLDGTDIRVMSANGYNQLASLVSVTPTGDGSPLTATYRIQAPGGVWDTADAAIYSVSLRESQVADISGNFAAEGTLGFFQVDLGETPTAMLTSLTATTISTADGTYQDFTVTYSDNQGISAATIDNADLRVTGQNGFNQMAVLSGVDATTDGPVRVATYRITPPGGTWDSQDSSTYTVSLEAYQVSDTGGHFVTAGSLGTFVVNIPAEPTPDTVAPTATVTLPEIGDDATVNQFTVSYADNVAIDASTIDSLDIRVQGPNGMDQLATLVNVDSANDGTPRIATYEISVPGGTWDSTDNGDYTVSMESSQVTDTSGNAVPAGVLTTYHLDLPEPTPPSADVSLSVDGPGHLIAGQAAVYTITLVNHGTVDATDVSVTDTLPGAVSFASVTAGDGFDCTSPDVGALGGEVVFTADTLAAGSTATLTITAVTDGTCETDGLSLSNSAALTTGNTNTNAQTTCAVDTHVDLSGVATQTNPFDPTKTDLIVGGGDGVDGITIFSTSEGTFARLNTRSYGPYQVNGRVMAFGRGGIDSLVVGQVHDVTPWIFGGSGNDAIVDSHGSSILVGGSGIDSIVSTGGNSLMIGGDGMDTLQNAPGNSIQIAGRTDYDANQAALNAIFREWTCGDSYQTRVDHLRGTTAGGLSDAFPLNSTKVHDDGAADYLFGGRGSDWYFAHEGLGSGYDLIAAKHAGDLVEEI